MRPLRRLWMTKVASMLQGHEGNGPIISIQEFQEQDAGLSTYLKRCNAAVTSAKLSEAKKDRSVRLASR